MVKRVLGRGLFGKKRLDRATAKRKLNQAKRGIRKDIDRLTDFKKGFKDSEKKQREFYKAMVPRQNELPWAEDIEKHEKDVMDYRVDECMKYPWLKLRL